MSYSRSCRDCPIPECGAKYLVKLSNHLADVHGLSCDERRKWLQESKLQPIVKVIQYGSNDELEKHSSTLAEKKQLAKRQDNCCRPMRKQKQFSKQSAAKQRGRWSPLPF